MKADKVIWHANNGRKGGDDMAICAYKECPVENKELDESKWHMEVGGMGVMHVECHTRYVECSAEPDKQQEKCLQEQLTLNLG